MSMNQEAPMAEAADDGAVSATEALREYILSGRTAAGKKVTERVEAASADAAVEALKQRGYTEIVSHTDDVGALFTQQKKVAHVLTPKDYIGSRQRGGYWAKAAFIIRKLYLQNWKWNLFFLITLVVRRWMDLRWGFLDYSAIGLLLFPLVFGLISQLSNPALAYDRLIELVAWGRWEEVLQQADGLRGRVPEHELTWQKGKALAGLGRLNEAIALVTPLADAPAMPPWHFYSRLGEVYALADQRDETLKCGDKALELAPDNATLLVDKAMTLLRYQMEIPRARQLLVQARSHALSDVLSPAADAVEGMLLLEEGHPHEAREKLAAALAGLDRFRAATPLIGALQDRFRAYLALALAAIGERAEAERQFRLAEPRLRALRRTELLARCERAIGTFAPHLR